MISKRIDRRHEYTMASKCAVWRECVYVMYPALAMEPRVTYRPLLDKVGLQRTPTDMKTSITSAPLLNVPRNI